VCSDPGDYRTFDEKMPVVDFTDQLTYN